MCGIAGVMTADGGPPDPALLERLTDALAHRGPDGRGRHVADGVGLTQTRLAIIDLATGDQPIHAPEGNRPAGSIVANAEIYNYRELRATMGEGRFTTRSDVEPALHLYLDRGTAFASGLRGMYAVAIHDTRCGRLILARDPFGIKPLYYVESALGLVFASEPSALIRAGAVSARLRPEARDELLELQFTTGRETPFAGVQRLLPGETAVVERGRVVTRERRQALPAEGPAAIDADGALERLDSLLTETVELHQRADVPYAMFLSGGVDSSVVLAVMARLNERPVLAFTAGFADGIVHDERDHARAVAAAAAAEHVEVEFDEEDFWRLLPAITEALDDPSADYAALPTFKLAETVRAAGIKVVLTGEGGDELFGGYGRYRRATRWRVLGGRPMRAAGAFDGLGVLRRRAPHWRDGVRRAELAERRPGRSRLQVAQATDCADWLPNDLLAKLDRCLMAHGVEGRVPFLDPVLAAFAFRLPDRLKTRRRLGKWLLRRWLETRLPAAAPFSRKRGFTVPVGEWIARRGRRLAPLVAGDAAVGEVAEPTAVAALFASLDVGADKRRRQAAWILLFYALWHRRHVRGLAAEGGVFSTLAAGG